MSKCQIVLHGDDNRVSLDMETIDKIPSSVYTRFNTGTLTANWSCYLNGDHVAAPALKHVKSFELCTTFSLVHFIGVLLGHYALLSAKYPKEPKEHINKCFKNIIHKSESFTDIMNKIN